MKIYIVKAGEDLSQIAAKKNVSIQSLWQANPTVFGQQLCPPGTKIRIPHSEMRIAHDGEREPHETAHTNQQFDIEHFFEPYYAYQKRWLDQMKHCAVHDDWYETKHPASEHISENDEENRPPVSRKSTKRKTSTHSKKRKKWKKRVKPILENRVEQKNHEETQLPWLNV